MGRRRRLSIHRARRDCGMLLVVASSRRSLRVLHTADVHLDSDGYGNPARQAAHAERGRAVFRAIVDRALTDRVDLLLIAGDLFDHNRASDATVAFVRDELARLGRPVVILPGNHDALCTNAIYDRHDFTAGASRVHVIRRPNGETVDFPELDACPPATRSRSGGTVRSRPCRARRSRMANHGEKKERVRKIMLYPPYDFFPRGKIDWGQQFESASRRNRE
jgi:Calcineurin-like phosphoesterase